MTPVITPLELEYALGEADASYFGLGGDRLYSLDYRDLESMKEVEEPSKFPQSLNRLSDQFDKNELNELTRNREKDDDSEGIDRPYYSLITGQFKSDEGMEHKDVISLSYETNGLDEDCQDLIPSTSSRELSTFSSAAAKYLHSLEFQGLVLKDDTINQDEALDIDDNDDNGVIITKQTSKDSKFNGAKIEPGTLGIASNYSSIQP